MNAEFEAIKARFKEQVEKKDKKDKKPFGNSDIYAFWNKEIGMGEEVVIRILRDSDPTNTEKVFYIEKNVHELSVNGKDRKVICIEKHFGEKCPICELSRKYYKAGDKDQGLYFYIKKKFLLKALVIKDPLPVDPDTKENAEGKVKVFQLTKKLLDKIMLEMATELDNPPWDLKNGYNFKIKKMAGSGGNADYLIGSGFARGATEIPQNVVDAIEPTNLAALLPPNPGLEYVQRLLNSHLTGEDTTEEGNSDEDEEDAAPSTASVAATVASTTKPEAQFGEEFVAKLEASRAEGQVQKTEAAKAETSVDSDLGVLDEDEDETFKRILAKRNAAKAAAGQ